MQKHGIGTILIGLFVTQHIEGLIAINFIKLIF